MFVCCIYLLRNRKKRKQTIKINGFFSVFHFFPCVRFRDCESVNKMTKCPRLNYYYYKAVETIVENHMNWSQFLFVSLSLGLPLINDKYQRISTQSALLLSNLRFYLFFSLSLLFHCTCYQRIQRIFFYSFREKKVSV